MAKKHNTVRAEEQAVDNEPVVETVETSAPLNNGLAQDLMSMAQEAPQSAEDKPKEPTVLRGKTGAEWIAEYRNKSNAIRGLAQMGCTRGEIAKCLDIRYQHVRNVLTQVLKRKSNTTAASAPAPTTVAPADYDDGPEKTEMIEQLQADRK